MKSCVVRVVRQRAEAWIHWRFGEVALAMTPWRSGKQRGLAFCRALNLSSASLILWPAIDPSIHFLLSLLGEADLPGSRGVLVHVFDQDA